MSDVVTAFSPAKVNLHLAIGERRPDGYHGARSVMHALSLHDTLTVRRECVSGSDDFSVQVRCVAHEGVEPLEISSEDNIVYKALMKAADAFDCGRGETVDVVIDKHIPHAAGLGGGSSNAAAALLAACRLWGVDPESREVFDIAAGIGADVPFFLRGGCAVLGDRGDVFERELVPMKGALVLIRPNAGVSTAAAYRAFDEDPAPVSSSALENERNAQSAEDLQLFNNLASASERVLPELVRVREWLGGSGKGIIKDEGTGEPCVLLSGSGSATFCLCEFDGCLPMALFLLRSLRAGGLAVVRLCPPVRASWRKTHRFALRIWEPRKEFGRLCSNRL